MTITRNGVLNVVRGKVGVPDTGTCIVADGVVREAAPRYVKERLWPGGRVWKWTLEAEEPLTPFFEEGKTYGPRGRTFKVEIIRDDTAFGYLTGEECGDRWAVRNKADWDQLDWTEV
ncbi:hypothetical protein [Streptomyces omiyaensis]|uniref:Uncharacterized protein n=1 Tax=Streptomyces omiyaensis TaxID=68247 RepID=A0ABW7C4K9_9ACTN